MKSLSTVLVMLLAVGLVAATGGPARAELIAYDGFGTSGNLNGSTGSPNHTGFSAAWTATTGTGDNTGFVLDPTSMPMPTNYVGAEGGSVRLRTDNNTTGYATRPLTTPLLADSGDTWYFSFEAQPNANPLNSNSNVPNEVWGLAKDTSTALPSYRRIMAGYSAVYSGSKNWVRGFLYVTTGAGANTSLLTTYDIGRDPKFYVAKVVTHTGGSVDAYLKWYANTETLPATEPTTWDLQVVGVTGLAGVSYGYAMTTGKAYVNYGGNGNAFDEFRIGNTWQDVVPIPEPSTLALLATGLIGLLCYAWRRRK